MLRAEPPMHAAMVLSPTGPERDILAELQLLQKGVFYFPTVMNKLPFTLLSLVTAAGPYALPQSVAQPGTSHTVSCQVGENCTSRLADGATVLTLKDDTLVLQVSLAAFKRFTLADIGVTNTSNGDLDVVPTTFQLLQSEGGNARTALPLPEVLKKEGRRDKTWAHFFDMGPSATKQETIVVAKHKETGEFNQSGDGIRTDEIKSVQVTVPDEEARAAARARINQREQILNSDLTSINQSYLRANTVAPGASLRGTAYFTPSHPGEQFILVIPVGDRVYRFSLTAAASE